MELIKLIATIIGGLILVYLLVFYSKGSIGLSTAGFNGVIGETKTLQGR